MKKILTVIMTLASLLITTTNAVAENNGNRGNTDKRKSKKVEVVRSTETSAGKTKYRMSTETEWMPESHKFVINGHVALDIPDSCYNIYMTDIDKEVTTTDLLTCVPVRNTQFRFETDINTMKSGRIRAIFPGDELCPAWINLYFIPGFTLDMTVHNGYYDIHNESEYNFMINAWLNKGPLAVLCNSMGVSSGASDNDEQTQFQKAISAYQDILGDLSDQLKQAQNLKYVPTTMIQSECQRILNQMEKVNQKMQELIDNYANSIKF